MKVCLHIIKALGVESSARGCRKENTLFQKHFWQNKSYWRTIFQEAASGILAKYKMEHFPTRLDSF